MCVVCCIDCVMILLVFSCMFGTVFVISVMWLPGRSCVFLCLLILHGLLLGSCVLHAFVVWCYCRFVALS